MPGLRLLWLTSGERRLGQLVSPAFTRACADLLVEPRIVDVREPDAVQRAIAENVDIAASRFAYRPFGYEAARAVEAAGVSVINRSSAIQLASDQIDTI